LWCEDLLFSMLLYDNLIVRDSARFKYKLMGFMVYF
jgi:hypothetical protein